MKTYLTNCVSSTTSKINSMVDRARRISYRSFIEQVDQEQLKELFDGYSWQGKGLKLKDDYAVSFYKSLYEGRECVFIDHSRIEYIFI